MDKTAKNTPKPKVYSANEICNIIKTCSKYGVADISIGGVEINFKSQGTDKPKEEIQWVQPKMPALDADMTPLKPLQLNDNDIEEIRELELAQQAIDDPIGFEQGIINEFMDGEANAEANGHSEAQ